MNFTQQKYENYQFRNTFQYKNQHHVTNVFELSSI